MASEKTLDLVFKKNIEAELTQMANRVFDRRELLNSRLKKKGAKKESIQKKIVYLELINAHLMHTKYLTQGL